MTDSSATKDPANAATGTAGERFDPDEWADSFRPGGCEACGSRRAKISHTGIMTDAFIHICSDCGHQWATRSPAVTDENTKEGERG